MAFIFPDIHVYQFDTSEISDPSGSRHIEGGSFAFVQRVGLNCSIYSGPGTSGTLDFGPIRIDPNNYPDYVNTEVIALVFRVATSGTGVSNMRLYLTDRTALTLPAAYVGRPPGFVQIASSGIWQPNSVLPSGAGTTLGVTVPSIHNIKRQDGKTYMAASEDQDVSEYVYMNVVLPNSFPLGAFGVCGSGLLRFGLVFDYFESESFLQFGEP